MIYVFFGTSVTCDCHHRYSGPGFIVMVAIVVAFMPVGGVLVPIAIVIVVL